VRGPELTTAALTGDAAAALQAIPARSGVGQILAAGGKSLVIGRPANLRRWMASHLGAGPVKKGVRPPVDLRPVAVAARYAVTTSPLFQRLLFERLMALYVPRSARRDLKRPSWIHLDPAERFPRLSLRAAAAGSRQHLFGPFRDRGASGRALETLHRRLPMRPCDYTFEPDPELPLGLGCLFAQVRSCAAPCLARVTEEAYRELAREAGRLLGRPWERPAELLDVLPPWVAAEEGRRALLVEAGAHGLELVPVVDGAVVEENAGRADPDRLAAALSGLSWEPPAEVRDDQPWLLAWLHAPRRSGAYVALPPDEPAEAVAERVRAALLPGPTASLPVEPNRMGSSA
jgi:hypothetical protein